MAKRAHDRQGIVLHRGRLGDKRGEKREEWAEETGSETSTQNVCLLSMSWHWCTTLAMLTTCFCVSLAKLMLADAFADI